MRLLNFESGLPSAGHLCGLNKGRGSAFFRGLTTNYRSHRAGKKRAFYCLQNSTFIAGQSKAISKVKHSLMMRERFDAFPCCCGDYEICVSPGMIFIPIYVGGSKNESAGHFEICSDYRFR
jgi:hypothetical protein